MDLDTYLQIIRERTTLVYFTAKWCGPCKKIAPLFEKIKAEAPDYVTCLKIDVDDSREISEAEEIRSMPTFLFYRSGYLISTVKGAHDEELKNNYRALIALEEM